jgi:hypothetical protein
MRRLLPTLLTLASIMGLCPDSTSSQSLPYPILFVTQVPTPYDSANVASLFGNHVADMPGAPRGGDLWIRYPDGSLKNLTQAAGYGTTGTQGVGAIAVREPSVHWSGTKALFSMVVGGAAAQGDTTTFYWQIYEITGLGKDETPVVRKIPNQPQNFNNVSPIYGTDDRIIFTSDRPPSGDRHLYPAFDEYKGTPTNTGLWSLDPATGDLNQLDHSPSGDFSPTIDSYGRVLVMRWDRLQRDRNADMDALGTAVKGTFNYTDESPTGQPQYGVRTETFPEPQGSRTDLLAGTNMNGFEFNQFFPWQIGEDGTSPETLNHLGRHEMRPAFNRSINDDSNVVAFNYANTNRSNRNPIVNFMQVREDAKAPGLYYGVDALQSGTHSGGQIVSLTASPQLDPNQTVVTYITDRSTQGTASEGGTPNPNHSGFYSNPLPLSDGSLIAAHSTDPHADKNLGTTTEPISRFAYRLTTLKKSGNVWVADQPLTTGISKDVSYWDPNVLVRFSGTLWELDPVEVRPRTRPARLERYLPTQEKEILVEEGVDEAKFRSYLREKNLAVAVSRDVTHRDGADRQQPFYLKIAGSTKATPNATGKVYDVTDLQFYEGDYIRGSGLTSPNATPHPGRRILAVPMHLPVGTNPDTQGGANGIAKLADDGSMAAFVPAHRATTWQLTDPNGQPVVRERYWVTFQPGEIRVCASCHGTNDDAAQPLNPIPQNKPEAFRDLLRFWKSTVLPSHVTLTTPANETVGVGVQATLQWLDEGNSSGYRVQISTTSEFATSILDSGNVAGTTIDVPGLAPNTIYYWRVQGSNAYGDGVWSNVWHFTTASDDPQLPAAPQLVSPANDTTDIPFVGSLLWNTATGADAYHVQLAATAEFSTTLLDDTVATTTIDFSALAARTKYYWRVRAIAAAGAGPWSATWNFTTYAEVPHTPATPTLVSPANDSTGVPISRSLRWEETAGATSYRVQLATSTDFATPLLDRNDLTSPSATFSNLARNTRYYWHVNASNSLGTGEWSATWSFTTVAEQSGTEGATGETEGLRLERNHPDPFSETTTLSAFLPHGGPVSMVLYDMQGTAVASLLNGTLDAGHHTFRIDAGSADMARLANGVYVVRLQTPDGTRELLVHLVR